MFKKKKILINLIVFINCLLSLVECVNIAVQDKLSKEEFLELDQEVSDFYNDNYYSKSMRNVSLDQELYKSLRALRHTVVLHQFDFFYSNQEIIDKSIGSKVNEDLCKIQLTSMVRISKLSKLSISLDAVNFLESNGKVEPGYLNGDTYWQGAVSTCERAKINANYWQSHLNEKEKEIYFKNKMSLSDKNNDDIVGRYCIAHIKSKSWPKYDKYFEDRLSVKLGLCIPESCHSGTYFNSTVVQELIDHLARYNLAEPFNGNTYYTDYLYCFPDEDSPFRQWDFGTKMFICFVIIWISILIYTNIKYSQRIKTVKKLRNTVDIKMIINQRKYTQDTDTEDDDEDDVHNEYDLEFTSNHDRIESQQLPTITHTGPQTIDIEGAIKKAINVVQSSDNKLKRSTNPNQVKDGDELVASGIEPASSLVLPEERKARSTTGSPIPSDIEENDGEFNVIRSVVCPKKTTKRQSISERNAAAATTTSTYNLNKQYHHQEHQQQYQGFDLIKAFSIASNLAYLFQDRAKEKQTKEFNSQKQQVDGQTLNAIKRLSLNSVSRRTSSSNEALIKDLTQQKDGTGNKNDSAKSKVAIVAQHQQSAVRSTLADKNRSDHSSSTSNYDLLRAPTLITKKKKRVDVDIFDGIKAFATSYIVMSHTMMFFYGVVTDLRFGNERMFDFTMSAIINGLQVVGLFYIITGALVTYLSFSKQKTKQLLQPTFWLLVIIGRYIRLLPPYLLVFWFARHVAPYTGSGAFWKEYRTDLQHVRGYCSQQDWSTVLLMSSADVKIPYDCVPQAWYLSNDFRTLFILPIFVMILVLNTFAGYAAIFATIIYSVFKSVRRLRQANIDYGVLLLWQPHVYSILCDRLDFVYTNLDLRLSTYLLGVIVGHLLYLYEQKKIKQWPRIIKLYGLKFVTISIILLFNGANVISNPYFNQFFPSRDELDSDTLLMLIPFFKMYMEVCICVLLLLLATGSGNKWILNFLSSKMSKVFSQISYGVFLLHIEIMFKIPQDKVESDYWYLFLNGTFFIISSNAVAFIIYVLYEMPINNIMRQLFKKIFQMFVK